MAYTREGVGNGRGRERCLLLRVKATQHVYRRKTGRVAITWCSRTLRYGQVAGRGGRSGGGALPAPRPTTTVPSAVRPQDREGLREGAPSHRRPLLD